jgi:protein-tyrosine-phosphatase
MNGPDFTSDPTLNGPARTRRRSRLLVRACVAVFFGMAITGGAGLTHAAPVDKQTVVFVCLHGSVKSQMAAAHFNRIAKERGLNITAISRGIEPDKSIPASVRTGLAHDGLAPASEVPSSLRADEASDAAGVFAFDDVPGDRSGTANVTRWSDVPPALQDYARSRDAIVRHVEEVVDRLARDAHPASPADAKQ